MYLHEAIQFVLKQAKRPMSTKEIAEVLNQNKLYQKGNDSPEIQSFQIHGRTKNYPHLFVRSGSMVSLVSDVQLANLKARLKDLEQIPKATEKVFESTLAVKVLMNEKNFKPASEIDRLVPNQPGMYCIRLKEGSVLPQPFYDTLKKRNHNIIYIGIASQSLSKRFLGQELRANGHGTFFRSLGAVLGFRPLEGSLAGKANQNNYTFSSSDEQAIIDWINQNLIVNWVCTDSDLNAIESNLIQHHLPLLNIAGNPAAMKELTALRNECKRIARG